MAYQNNPMVIKVYMWKWSVKRVFIDRGSSTDVLYWDAFKGMGMDTSEMLPFKGTLIGFVGEQVQVLGHMLVLIVFGSGNNAKSVKVRYLIVNISSSYNIIIGRPSFNTLEAALSKMYLKMKYPLCVGGIRMIKWDLGLARKC